MNYIIVGNPLHGRRLQLLYSRLVRILIDLLPMVYFEGRVWIQRDTLDDLIPFLTQGRESVSVAVPCASEDGFDLLEIDDSRLLDHVERWPFITTAVGS